MSARAFLIRPVEDADVDAVAVIAEAVGFGWSVDAIRESVRRPVSRARVLTHAERCVGFDLWQIVDDEAELLAIAVTPELQRRGGGRALLEAAVEAGTAEGVVRFFLEVRETNEAARALYRGLGFQEVGRRPRYYPERGARPAEDAVCLVLTR